MQLQQSTLNLVGLTDRVNKRRVIAECFHAYAGDFVGAERFDRPGENPGPGQKGMAAAPAVPTLAAAPAPAPAVANPDASAFSLIFSRSLASKSSA